MPYTFLRFFTNIRNVFLPIIDRGKMFSPVLMKRNPEILLQAFIVSSYKYRTCKLESPQLETLI